MVRQNLIAWILTAGLLASLLAPPVSPAWAQNATTAAIQVSSFEDDLQQNGNCTLREAVIAANTDQAVDACPAGSGADTIQLAAGVYTLTLAGINEDEARRGDLDLLESVSILGAGAGQTVIDGGGLDRVLEILPAEAEVLLQDLTVAGGVITEEIDFSQRHGAGIKNQAALTLNRARLTQNTSQADSARGGGIYNTGTLTLLDSQVEENELSTESAGAGVYNLGTLLAENSSISFNRAFDGSAAGLNNQGSASLKNSRIEGNSMAGPFEEVEIAGITNGTGKLTCDHCLLRGAETGNSSLLQGGGEIEFVDSELTAGPWQARSRSDIVTFGTLRLIRSRYTGSDLHAAIQGNGVLVLKQVELTRGYKVYPYSLEPNGAAISFNGSAWIEDSLIAHNRGEYLGGAIYGSGEWTILNSAIVSNTVLKGPISDFEDNRGGGMYWAGGVLTVTNTTFSGNSAGTQGGGLYVNAGEVWLNNVTFSQNTANTAGGGVFLAGGSLHLHNALLAGNQGETTPDCAQVDGAGQLVSHGYNLIGVADGCTLDPAAGDQAGSLANPLDPQLGPLQENGGPTPTHALLPGSPALDAADPAGCPPTDQRGISRPQGPRCDVGAFELEKGPVPPAGQQVKIDIRPGDKSNTLYLGSGKTVPVAILSTPGFFAPLQANPSSLTFGRTGEEDSLAWMAEGRLPNCRLLDANRDRRLDLVCRFRMEATGFQAGDTVGILKGETYSHQPFWGQDAVRVVEPGQSLSPQLPDEVLEYEGEHLYWLPRVD